MTTHLTQLCRKSTAYKVRFQIKRVAHLHAVCGSGVSEQGKRRGYSGLTWYLYMVESMGLAARLVACLDTLIM